MNTITTYISFYFCSNSKQNSKIIYLNINTIIKLQTEQEILKALIIK